MISLNPFGDFRSSCEKCLSRSFLELQIPFEHHLMDVPSNPEFGELASAACFELAKRMAGSQPRKLAIEIMNKINPVDYDLIDVVKVAGGGYINFYANLVELSKITLASIQALDEKYGSVNTDDPKKIIVEHTSANPISPIHVGQGRNPILGDALARILKARGHTVFRHFYVDDVGRQTAVAAYGYAQLDKPLAEKKADHHIGLIYTLTSCITEVRRLKQALKQASSDTRQELHRKLAEWTAIAEELRNKHTKLFNQLLDRIGEEENLSEVINQLNRNYESGDQSAKDIVRTVCQISLKGIEETLTRIGVKFDSWDWESDLVWNGDVAKTLKALEKTEYAYYEGPVLEFNADKVAEDLDLKQLIEVKNDYDIPSLTLTRADGTTLYTTRDIPYTMLKFEKADRVINVVGLEQKLAQQQLKLALWALGHAKQAENLTHFAYSLVTLPGFRMSSRRGRYITFDEVIDESIKRAYEEVEKRSPQLPEEKKKEISEIVGIGALKYAFLEVDPIKPVIFTWDRVLNFERNSAPYIQYSHARACSILRKAENTTYNPDYSLLTERLEKDLILILARFPETCINSAESLKPNTIAEFANQLADKFNSFYNTLPVIKCRPKELMEARLVLVKAVSIVIKNVLNLVGIVAPEKM
jgi:arginyl-tRNA synthetase